MKKFISILLALMLVMSLGTVAFAANGDEKIVKTYAANGSTAVSPAETFAFSVEFVGATNTGVNYTEANAQTNLPSIADAVYEVGDAGDELDGVKNLAITLPEYDDIGIYTYKVAENATNTAGVVAVNEFKLVVTVAYDEADNTYSTIAIHTETAGGEKTNDITNTYSAGTLAIEKEVTGEFGDRQQDFTVNVTFNAPEGKVVRSAITYTDDNEDKTVQWDADGKTATAEITLKHGETVKFDNIPTGVSYTVVENQAEGYDDPMYDGSVIADGYTSNIEAYEDDTLTITNNKGGSIDTGISLDSLPYILMLVVVCAAIVIVSTRKKGEQF